ncbi:hypothetical protein FRC11_001875 [Ceratobasidium sp. 423]|nr:hypothetical protein FRC11_001875 [Ceratobasidium sp. 423]
MSSRQQLSPSENLRNWEETGQQLEKTVIAFLDSCSALEHSEFGYLDRGQVISSIKDRIRSLDKLIKQRLDLARSSMSSLTKKLKKKLRSSIQRLPVEILTRIFHLVIHHLDLEVEDPEHLSYSYRSKSIYRKLYRLFGVCSVWKKTLLSQGTFWSLVPVVDLPYDSYTLSGARLNLERAAGSKLHLVAALTKASTQDFVLDTLTRFGSRIKAVNFNSNSPASLEKVVHALVRGENHSSDCLTSLSLFYTHGWKYGISLQSVAWQKDLHRVLEPLRVLRLRKLEIPLRGLLFKNLTELRLQDISIGAMADLEDTLWTLSSSSQLQLLEVISVRAYRNPPDTTPRSYNFPISLPSLKVLYLEDLAHNLLELILGSIAPGSHHVTLNFTKVCLMENIHTEQAVAIDPHRSKLPNFKIDTLMMDPNFHGNADEVATFLRLVPTVTELSLDQLELHISDLRPFINPEGPSATRGNYVMPRFTKLRITRSCFDSVDALDILQDVVASHPIVELGLGVGRACSFSGSGFNNLAHPPKELASYKKWFLKAVPKVVWLPGPTESTFDAEVSESDVWQL